MTDTALTRVLRELEERLLRPEVRHNAVALEALLVPEFVEFGSSGRVFDRDAIVALLVAEPVDGGAAAVVEFACELLAQGMALSTYCIARGNGAESLRSSVWGGAGWAVCGALSPGNADIQRSLGDAGGTAGLRRGGVDVSSMRIRSMLATPR